MIPMERLSVLVVDDETDFVETLVKRLEKKGWDVEAAYDAKEALKVLDARDFHVCILDVRMPGIDGIQALPAMKKKRPLMEVIILTGEVSAESGVRGLQLGAYDYLMKPVSFPDLLETMVSACERRVILEGRRHEN